MMTDEEKKIEQKIQPWRFWFSVVLTGFLIATFVLYLPMRFQYNALTHVEMDEMPGMRNAMMGGEHSERGSSLPHEAKDVREGLSVDLSYNPWPPQGHPLFGATSTQAYLNFYVNQKPDQAPVPVSELQVEHTKLMHVIGVRDDMNEFFHIHPVPVATSGVFEIQHTFQKPGRYKIWSEVKKDGIGHSFGQELIDMEGVGERSRKEVSFARNVTVGDYHVSLTAEEPMVKGKEASLVFDIHTQDGKRAAVEQYLGADMHLTIIKDDLTQFIHTHPEGGGHMMYRKDGSSLIQVAQAHGDDERMAMPSADEGIRFHAVFPEAGLYKTFAQFRPQGINVPPDEALTASFWIRVEGKTPAANPKIILFAVSLLAIVLLSWGVKKFLNIKPKIT